VLHRPPALAPDISREIRRPTVQSRTTSTLGFPALGSTVPSAVADPRTAFGCRAPPRYRSARAGQVAGAFAPRPLLANTRHTVLGEVWISRAMARTW